MANLVRFSSSVPSFVAKDTRGWLLDPISLARASGILGGALTCASVHIGEIRPGRLRGNHRHHDCNETFVLWGALIKFRLTEQKLTRKEGISFSCLRLLAKIKASLSFT
ncbi:hypothetical protein Ahy_B02g057220 isoform D [Arachis hypogaea]|uniref:Uncharacterized protein n=1 Tax=Arachis hypogaea TaxID=3818 RepID=A0A445AB73_ARAHY|nr:hypothetical protein Ahy_B02g057220 isoform D [Arachis hypogaea]